MIINSDPGGPRALLVPLATAGLLTATAGLHAVWAVSPWPFATRAEFAKTIVGVEEEQSPGPVPSLLVAGALMGGAGAVLAGGGLLRIAVPERYVRVSLWALAGVLGLRGAAGLLTSAADLGTAPWAYRRLDLALYSPLCLLLAAGVARTVRRINR